MAFTNYAVNRFIGGAHASGVGMTSGKSKKTNKRQKQNEDAAMRAQRNQSELDEMRRVNQESMRFTGKPRYSDEQMAHLNPNLNAQQHGR